MRRTVLAASLALTFAGPAQAGLDEGVSAWERNDYAAAYAELLPVAERGDRVAQYYLGSMYYNGDGVAQDFAKAHDWFRKSAEQGDAEAQAFLGDMYYYGEGVPQSYVDAASWYRRAAEQKLPYGEYSLALMQSQGLGMAQDEPGAAEVLRRLAEQGDRNSQRALGQAYEYGYGVPQDIAAAVEWYGKAADQGDGYSFGNLGRIYEGTPGVPRDLLQAHMFWNLAAARMPAGASRDHAVSRRDEIGGQLTARRLAEAQLRAAQYRPGVTEIGIATPLEKIGSVIGDLVSLGDSETREIESSGTGFLVSEDAHLLTNHHVVEDCREIRFTGLGHEHGRAWLLGADAEDDLALLRVEGRVKSVARFRAGGDVRQGEAVVAIGYPLTGLLGSDATVTTGTVSALSGGGGDPRLLQLTAPVQSGNSGGPLLDSSGNVVGIVTAKLDAMEIYAAVGDLPQNVNFAIKQSTVTAFLESNGLAYDSAPSGPPMPPADLAEAAKRFTLEIECWN